MDEDDEVCHEANLRSSLVPTCDYVMMLME